MDKNLHKDNLEEFFRRSFEEQKSMPPEEGWDLPSDDVWGGIAGSISGGSSGLLFLQSWKVWAVAASVLLGTVIFQFLSHQNQLNTLSTELTQQQEMIESLNAKLGKERQISNEKAVVDKTENTEKSDLNPNEINSENSFQNPIKTTDNQLVKNKTTAQKSGTDFAEKSNSKINSEESQAQNNTIKSEINSNPEKPNPEINITEKTDSNPLKKDAVEPVKKQRIFAGDFAKLPAKNSLVSTSNSTQLNLPNLEGLTPEYPTTETSKFSVTAYASPAFAKRVLKNNRLNIVRPFGEAERTEASYNTGLNFNYNLNNKWAVFTGGNYQKLRLSASHVFGFRYSKDKTVGTPTNDKIVTDHEPEIESSYGALTAEIRVQSDGTDVKENDLIVARARSVQVLRNVGLVAGIARRFEFGRWSLGLKVAAVPTWKLSNEVNLKDLTLPNRLVVKRLNIREKKFNNKLNNFTLDAQIGAGIAYKITPELSLAFEPTYRTNVTPFYETNHREARISSWALQTGLTYSF